MVAKKEREKKMNKCEKEGERNDRSGRNFRRTILNLSSSDFLQVEFNQNSDSLNDTQGEANQIRIKINKEIPKGRE